MDSKNKTECQWLRLWWLKPGSDRNEKSFNWLLERSTNAARKAILEKTEK